MGRKIGYGRVSTDEQTTARQIDGLTQHCDELRLENPRSAVAKHRPVFEGIVTELGAGDMLVVWDLDRAFRSTMDALATLSTLQERGVYLKILTLQIDTSTECGEFVYTVMAAAAQLERKRLIRRTKEGMDAARRRGKHIGRPRILSPHDARRARALMSLNPSLRLSDLARLHGCSPRTVARAVQTDYALAA